MKIVIGIDQSYKNTGISLVIDNKLVKYKTLHLDSLENHTERRKKVKKVLSSILSKIQLKYTDAEIMIICERIRTISMGGGASRGFGLSPSYLKVTGALVATIVDTAYDYGVPVFSVDTRSWKAKVVGNSKGVKKKVMITRGKNKGKYKTVIDTKSETMQWVKKHLGIDVNDNDDLADAICIGLYGFIKLKEQHLEREE